MGLTRSGAVAPWERRGGLVNRNRGDSPVEEEKAVRLQSSNSLPGRCGWVDTLTALSPLAKAGGHRRPCPQPVSTTLIIFYILQGFYLLRQQRPAPLRVSSFLEAARDSAGLRAHLSSANQTILSPHPQSSPSTPMPSQPPLALNPHQGQVLGY